MTKNRRSGAAHAGASGTLDGKILGWGLLLCSLLLVACGGDDDGDSSGGNDLKPGEASWGCKEERRCYGIRGPEAEVNDLVSRANCDGIGGVEVQFCPSGAIATCVHDDGISTQYYYEIAADKVETYRGFCEDAGGTFTPPPP